ncbi:biotin--[acetyl-CoA-carboxylase] ligase [Pallidibacillus pasinlerensis]|uniref:Bifunctional ligase/repressor BirA n=1 Tax=Pallidibacillus pasinlerensis TaxID=2703818 RepID=A0ABX0A1J9_9BACI|nr:biotin--[acetyl-CoA-carboxylase] ligase [Pallidibacillus pasinlerensis]NCU16401.1 biotin--[acetyl-CoA-carboxylase] ligase [Pallidibacillus pasinlerensis]
MKSNVRQALLDAFKHADGEYISGEKLAQTIGCSRTAIWKHIEELKKDGFQVEAVRKKGYRLVTPSNKLSEDEIYLGLQTETIGRSVYFYESVSSTQKIAKEYAMNGANHGTLIVADEQTEGRGRMVRKWHSPKGTGIWASFILRPDIQLQHAPQLTLLTAVAVVLAIKDVTNIIPEIKWPNDILINGRKVCGILTELQAEEDRIQSVIIGIGINVNQSTENFSDDIQMIATSLKIELEQTVNRTEIIQKLCYYLEQLLNLYISEGFPPIKRLWETYAISIGKQITARTLKGTFEGLALGINDEGVLLLKQANGEIIEILSADIEIK